MSATPSILIISGEVSGDILGAELIQVLKNHDIAADMSAVGGKAMQAAGASIIFDAERLSVVGFIEVLKHYKDIRAAFKTVKAFLKQKKPDLLVLIDYPGFNLRMAKFAHELGIKVLFYVSPQIWAWKYHRIHHIKKYVDHMAVLFPFEEAIYQKENIPVTFVGHHLAKKVNQQIKDDAILSELSLDTSKPIIGLFPGSRHSEIKSLMPVIIESAEKIRTQKPDAQFVLACAPGISPETIKPYLGDSSITVTNKSLEHVIKHCDAAITCSGTATLEIALNEVPMVIIYKLAALSYQIGKRVIKTPYIGLCNIVAGEAIAKELIQADANAEAICDETLRLLGDSSYRNDILEKLSKMHHQLGDVDTGDTLASLIKQLLTED